MGPNLPSYFPLDVQSFCSVFDQYSNNFVPLMPVNGIEILMGVNDSLRYFLEMNLNI